MAGTTRRASMIATRIAMLTPDEAGQLLPIVADIARATEGIPPAERWQVIAWSTVVALEGQPWGRALLDRLMAEAPWGPVDPPAI